MAIKQENIEAILKGSESKLSNFKNSLANLLASKNSSNTNGKSGSENLFSIYKTPTLRNFETISDTTVAGKTFNSIVNFLNQQNIANGTPATFDIVGAGSEGMRLNEVDADRLDSLTDNIYSMCEDLGIPADKVQYCAETIGTALYRYTLPGRWMEHFQNMGITSSSEATDLRTIYPAGVLKDATFRGSFNMDVGNEAFGVNSQNLLPDIKTIMSLGLLKALKGITNNLMHRINNDTGAVQYIVPNDEFYNLVKSQGQTTEERQSWTHRKQLIQLLRDPSPVEMDLIPVVPQKKNDTDGIYVLTDGVLLPNVTVPLWDLVMDGTKIGYERTDYTDLLSNKMSVRGVHLKVSADGFEDEYYFLNTSTYPSSSLVHSPNTVEDSGDYVCNLQATIQFDSDSMTVEDKDNPSVNSKIFGNCSMKTEYVGATLNFSAYANIMNAQTRGYGIVEPSGKVNTGSAPSKALIDILKTLKIEIIGWEPEYFYSEENYRKTNMAVRSMLDLYTYTLPDGRTIAIDSSMRQPDDEHMLELAARVQSIGFDNRNIELILKTMMSVRDRLQKENSDPRFIENFGHQTVARAFVSGRKIYPEIYTGVIDLNNTQTKWSSNTMSDVREYIRSELNIIMSRLHYRSLYQYELDGQAPVYNVLTTNPVIECLFSQQSIYPHFNTGGGDNEVYDVKAPNKNPAFTIKLANGTIFRFVTTTFLKMDNKMVGIPFRPNDPSSDLNYAVNYDGGQFVVNYNPVNLNEVNRRTLINYREYPITLCPIGFVIDVKGLDRFFPGVSLDLMSSK